MCILGPHLLLCSKTRQLVKHYVVFRSDCSQSRRGGQLEEMRYTMRVIFHLFLFLLLL